MGRHGRPEPDSLAGVDVAADLVPGSVIDTSSPVQAEPASTGGAGHRHGRPGVDPADPAGTADTADVIAGEPQVTAAEPPATEPGRISVPGLPAATTQASLVGTTIVARRDRQVERAARRAANRRKLLIVGAAALAVLLVVGVTVVVLSSRSKAPSANVAAKVPHQSTLLMQVAGVDGTADVSALMGVTPTTGDAAAVLIPAGLLVDDASSGNLPFGETLTLPSKQAPANALTDLLGVRVSDSWALTQPGLAALVDKVGGVQATVDVDVLTKNAKGDQAVVVRAGSQRLNGGQAAAYATYLAEGEPEAVRLARFNDVLDEVLRHLPATQAQIATVLTGLGAGSVSSLTAPQLAGLLVTARAAAVKERLHYDLLPVSNIDTGDTVATYGLDSGKAGPLLQTWFAPSLQKDRTGDTVRVLVENGVGTPDLVAAARTKLVRDGFQFITGGNASDLSPTDASVVLIQDGSAKSQARGDRVAKSLGLPHSAIALNPRGQTVADVIVILGADFKP
jgi:hypothetical protein